MLRTVLLAPLISLHRGYQAPDVYQALRYRNEINHCLRYSDLQQSYVKWRSYNAVFNGMGIIPPWALSLVS